MSTATHPADEYMDSYRVAFEQVYGREPVVRYMGNQWYQVNGEMVHHTIIVSEISRLHDLALLQRRRTQQQSVIARLIKKLRSI